MTLIARLKHRVTLQTPLSNPDGVGGRDTTWSDLADTWARITPITSGEKPGHDAVALRQTYKVTMRFRDDVSADMRIVFAGKAHDILSLSNVEMQNRWLECICREIV